MSDEEAAAPKPEEHSSASWSDLLAELIRSFILLRDVFGYILPGAFFFCIGALLSCLSIFGYPALFPSAESHPWLLAFLALALCYVTGQFVVATSYLFQDLRALAKRVHRHRQKTKVKKFADKKVEEQSAKQKSQKEAEEKRVTAENDASQSESDFLRLHRDFPEIYVEYDRQSIISLLRRGLAASVVLGILVFRWYYQHPLQLIGLAGGVMLLNAISSHFHMKDLHRDTLRAAKDAESRLPSVRRL